MLRAAELRPGLRVLDVGCGFGTLLQHAAEAGAVAFGVDISEPMVEAARDRAPTATVAVADAQTDDLRALAGDKPVDRVVSRFGVMFFDDPAAAFANIRSAAAPGARLAFVCWREGDNAMFTVGNSLLATKLESPPAAPDPAAPGPLALGSAERVRTVLSQAGWTHVDVSPFDGICNFSVDGSDGVEERLTMILSSSLGVQARAELAALPDCVGRAALASLVDYTVNRHG